MQVSRLLLPSMALLSVPAADVIMRVWRASPRSRYVIIAPVAMSVSVVVAVGIVRFGRYVADPTAFLGAETQHYDSIVWINANLDPAHDRVATWFKTCAYLNVPWMNLDPSYQVEIRPQEIEDPRLLAAALKRQGFTYVFGPPSAFAGIEDSLRVVRTNSASRLGGTRFFRTPLTGAAAIMAIR